MLDAMIAEVQWPFLLVGDAAQRPIGWALLKGPLQLPEEREAMLELRRAGYRFCGLTSFMSFPRNDETGDARDYRRLCEAWCHCFREPDRHLLGAAPRSLTSESDFLDASSIAVESARGRSVGEPADFVYACPPTRWKEVAKNWQLARRCIPRICDELDLRCLVVGHGSPDDIGGSPRVRCTGQLPWRQFLATLASARFLLVPNVLDASPRVLVEALCLDVPVVVNRRILGGWKYVNEHTGTFFTDEGDAVEAVRRCLAAERSPRAWFASTHGPRRAGRRLLSLLRAVDPSISERSHLVIGERLSGPARGHAHDQTGTARERRPVHPRELLRVARPM